ncbi:hypothetical protein BKA93DRAFT_713286, partial [Sparassis latifolia]
AWQANTLEKVQNQALRRICAAFRTTQCAALCVVAGLMPARQHLDLINENTAIRFHKLDHNHPIRQRLPTMWRRNEPIMLLDTEDGTKTGAGLVILYQDCTVAECKYHMGMQAEVYDAELKALTEGAVTAIPITMSRDTPVWTIFFCADNSSAIGTITANTMHPG